MSLASPRRSIGKHRGVEAVQHALHQKLRRHIEHPSGVDILIKGVVEGVLLLTGTILAQLVSRIFFCKVLRVLKHYDFVVKDLHQIELSFEDLFLKERS